MSIQEQIKKELNLTTLQIAQEGLQNDLTGIRNNEKKDWFQKQIRYYESLSPIQKQIVSDYANYGSQYEMGEHEQAELRKIIMNAPPLANRMVVWSGRTRRDSAKENQSNRIYRNRRFVSTSIVLNVADTFAFTALYKIILPKNSRCLYIRGKEFEVLLPKNASFYIMDRSDLLQYTLSMKKKIQITTLFYLLY